MKDIKFRAWDTVREKWIHDYLISPFGFVMCGASATMYYNGVHETKILLMQFTGIKDKKGKEIYEDDLVAANFRTTKEIMPVAGVIIFDEYMLCLKDGLSGEIYSINRLYDFLVVGNIYENHEVIK